MMKIAVVIAVVMAGAVRGHLWLESPVSMGGMNNNGGTTSPCNNLNPTGAAVTTLTAGAKFDLQMRANLHGGDPFSVTVMSDVGASTFSHTVLSGFAYDLRDVPDGDDFTVTFTVPNVVCSDCVLQLKGMGNNGQGAWYNCALINIVEPPCVDRCPEEVGTCNEDVCECKKGLGGYRCDVVTAKNSKSSAITLSLDVPKKDFDKDAFVAALAAETGITADHVDVVRVKKDGSDAVEVEVTLWSSESVEAADAMSVVLDRVANDQSVGTYDVSSAENHPPSGGGSGNDADVAAGVTFFFLILIGAAVGVGYYFKKNPEKLAEVKAKAANVKLPGRAPASAA